jgi:hypothetical protein
MNSVLNAIHSLNKSMTLVVPGWLTLTLILGTLLLGLFLLRWLLTWGSGKW